MSVKPFALTSPSQFRPPAPIALTSPRWATDFNEMKDFGSLTSAKRTPRQTEDGRFWFATDGRVYYPLIRATAEAKKLNLIDCARLYALAAMARHAPTWITNVKRGGKPVAAVVDDHVRRLAVQAAAAVGAAFAGVDLLFGPDGHPTVQRRVSGR